MKARASRMKKKEEESEHGTPPPPPPPPRAGTSSAEKRKKLTFGLETPKKVLTENIVIDKKHLVELCDSVLCQECCESKLECKFIRHQADTFVKVICSKCHKVAVNTTLDIEKAEGKRYYPVTLIVVYFAMLLGVGYSGVETLCGMLSLSHFTYEKYVEYCKFVTKKAMKHASELLHENRKAVFKFYAEKLNRMPDETGVLNTDVSFDGTWHTRGHTSLLGAGAVIDMHTGLIVDYTTNSKICVQCKQHETALSKKKITEEEYDEWKVNHREQCEIPWSITMVTPLVISMEDWVSLILPSLRRFSTKRTRR